MKNTAQASALRVSPLFSPAWTRRRNSTFCSQEQAPLAPAQRALVCKTAQWGDSGKRSAHLYHLKYSDARLKENLPCSMRRVCPREPRHSRCLFVVRQPPRVHWLAPQRKNSTRQFSRSPARPLEFGCGGEPGPSEPLQEYPLGPRDKTRRDAASSCCRSL
jgi:hypothetical protein